MTDVTPGTATGADYLARTAGVLWPGASIRVSRPGRAPGASGWLVLPSVRRPRMLVPAGCRAAAVMLNRHESNRREAWARALLRGAVASGWLGRLPVRRLQVDRVPGTDDFAQHLATILGGEQVEIGVLLGPVRANAKPVVQAFDGSGRTIAFAKLAIDGADDLVDREAAALSTLAAAELSVVQPPALLHHGRWAGHAIAVLSPLEASQSRRTDDDAEPAAAAEIAAVAGVREAPLVETVSRLRSLATALTSGADRDRMLRAVDAVEQAGPATLTTGAWHGDWSPWNMRRNSPGAPRLQVWDWERFDTGVAYGLDLVHHRAQLLWRDGVAADRCRSPLEDAAATMPPPAGYAAGQPAVRPDLLRQLYLIEVSVRYLGDQRPGGPPRPRTRWVLDQLSDIPGGRDTAS